MNTTIEEEKFFRADELVKAAESHIYDFADESVYYYSETIEDDFGNLCGMECYACSSPKSDEYAQMVVDIDGVKILSSKFLGYYNKDNLAAIFVKAELKVKEWNGERKELISELEETKNYIVFLDSDDLSSSDISEKDVHGWPEEFEWLQEELKNDDPPPS